MREINKVRVMFRERQIGGKDVLSSSSTARTRRAFKDEKYCECCMHGFELCRQKIETFSCVYSLFTIYNTL